MRLLKLVPDDTNIDFMRWRNVALMSPTSWPDRSTPPSSPATPWSAWSWAPSSSNGGTPTDRTATASIQSVSRGHAGGRGSLSSRLPAVSAYAQDQQVSEGQIDDAFMVPGASRVNRRR